MDIDSIPSSGQLTPRPIYTVQERGVVEGPSTRPYKERGSKTAIAIDNGSSVLRAGFATDTTPYIVRESITSKYRARKGNQMTLLAGQDVYADASSKANLRPPFEADVLCNSEAMEIMLDYVFVKLGLDGDSVAHPIAMTETMCTPAYSRSLMSELLFECYSVPSVAYASDSLAAFHTTGAQDGLIISSSTAATHVMPVLDGRGILNYTKRLSWGGAPAAEYMLKLVQLKFPSFPTRVTFAQAEDLVHEHCYLAHDYQRQLQKLADPDAIVELDRIIQLPFTVFEAVEKTQEELDRQQEQRKEAGRRLQEQQKANRRQNLIQKEESLKVLVALLEAEPTMSPDAFQTKIEEEGLLDRVELIKEIAKMERSLKRAHDKDLGIEPEEVEPNFPLVDVPDHQLDEEGLKDKRRQKLMKAGYDARIKLKAEKEAERARQEADAKRDLERRTADPEGWAADLRNQRETCLNRIAERAKRRSALADRKSVTAQNRMKSIATLAADMGGPKRKKRKAGEDTFGADDQDWNVYRTIAGAEDEEDEENDQDLLATIESRLLEHDPSFTAHDTAVSEAQRRNRLLNAFLRGDPPDALGSRHDPTSAEHAAQLHVNIERIRVPEALYQPSMAGIDQAGLQELIGHVLRNFDDAERKRLVGNVFVTGGHSLIPHFDERLTASMRTLLPINSSFAVNRPAGDVRLAPWQGLAKWGRSKAFAQAGVTLADYNEKGTDYLRDHPLTPSLFGFE